MTNKIFCKGCGKKLNISLMPGIYGEQTQEFEDGHYCLECAREKIKKQRSKLSK